MHSHMYFYASIDRPDWGVECPEGENARGRARQIANALLAAVPELSEPQGVGLSDHSGVWLYLSPLDQIYVHPDHVHWDIKYRSRAELVERDTMRILRAVAGTLEDAVGFDFFECGCQGLNERGSIEEMPAVLAGEYEERWLRREGCIG